MAGKQKLHEILAVEKDLENEAKKIVNEAIVTFVKKPEHFNSHHKKLLLFDDDKDQETQAAEEYKEIVTTVEQKLKYVYKAVTKYFDAIGKKEKTNQLAKADLILNDGTVLCENVPATLLLGLENKLKPILEMHGVIPTLQPGVDWEPDNSKGPNIFKAKHNSIRNKTERVPISKITVQPTKEHPAQVDKWTEDKVIGKFTQINWSGMISPADKSKKIAKVDEVIRCCKQARTRANATVVEPIDIGKKIFEFINK